LQERQKKKRRTRLGGDEAKNRNIRFPQALRLQLAEFASQTFRSEADVIRAAVTLLLRDGFDEAERRLAGALGQAAGPGRMVDLDQEWPAEDERKRGAGEAG